MNSKKNILIRHFKLLLYSCMLLIFSCSLSKITMNKLTNSLVNSSGVSFTGDDDPQLIGDALPFTIKFYESLLEKDSTNPALYLATTKLLCLYTQYFVAAPLDTIQDPIVKIATGKRAKKLFLRARAYSLKCLDLKTPGLQALILKGSTDTALSHVGVQDSAALFWCAASWFGAISSDRTDFSLALGIKKPLDIAKKVIAIDSTFGEGMAHEILGVASFNIPSSLGGGVDSAEHYFQKALQLSNKSRISTFVLYASSVAVKRGDREHYISLLNEALSIKISDYPSNRLFNTIYQGKAQQLLKSISTVFPDSVKIE